MLRDNVYQSLEFLKEVSEAMLYLASWKNQILLTEIRSSNYFGQTYARSKQVSEQILTV